MSLEFFRHWAPLELIKGMAADDEGKPTAKIGGVISDESVDMQGETVLQRGVDWSYFLKKGWFNYEHNNGPEFILGHPTSLKHDNGVTRVEGLLYLDRPRAREVVEAARDIAKATGGERYLGFSVEGQVLQRNPSNPKQILKARVLNVAITATPVNTGSNLDLLKSLAKACDYAEKGGDIGYQTPAGMGSGVNAPLVPQDVENELTDTTFKGPNGLLLLRDVGEIKKRFPKIGNERALELARIFRQSLYPKAR